MQITSDSTEATVLADVPLTSVVKSVRNHLLYKSMTRSHEIVTPRWAITRLRFISIRPTNFDRTRHRQGIASLQVLTTHDLHTLGRMVVYILSLYSISFRWSSKGIKCIIDHWRNSRIPCVIRSFQCSV